MKGERLKIKNYFIKEKKVSKGLLAFEWVAFGYMAFTLLMIALLWTRLQQPETLLLGRLRFVIITLAVWALYRLLPCRLTLFARIAAQMIFLSWWYPDTFELNRVLPNLDPVFASWEQSIFGCQPALLFAQKAPWAWFSELMCMGYVSYFALMVLVILYYFLFRFKEFGMASFVLFGAFFTYYVIFVLLPVTGPQFYYLAAGTENIAAGVFPAIGDWFLTHSEKMATPGWTDGIFYHFLELTHNAGERPTAAFPSSHVGITTILFLLACHSRNRLLIFTILPFYVLMCLATVYIQAHYAIDVIAGFVSGLLFYFIFLKTHRHYRLDV